MSRHDPAVCYELDGECAADELLGLSPDLEEAAYFWQYIGKWQERRFQEDSLSFLVECEGRRIHKVLSENDTCYMAFFIERMPSGNRRVYVLGAGRFEEFGEAGLPWSGKMNKALAAKMCARMEKLLR